MKNFLQLIFGYTKAKNKKIFLLIHQPEHPSNWLDEHAMYKDHKAINRFQLIYKLNQQFANFFNRRKHNLFAYFFFDKFKNRYMFQGQRHLITSIFNRVFLKFKFHLKINFQKILKALLFLIRPIFNYVYYRKPMHKFIVPIPIKWHKQYKIAINWVFTLIKTNFARSLEKKLLKAICRVLTRKRNSLIKKRNSFFWLITENRFYVGYRWK